MLITIIAIVIQTMAFLLHKETPDCGEQSGGLQFFVWGNLLASNFADEAFGCGFYGWVFFEGTNECTTNNATT